MILYPWNLQEVLGIKDYSLDVYNMDLDITSCHPTMQLFLASYCLSHLITRSNFLCYKPTCSELGSTALLGPLAASQVLEAVI